MHPIRSARRVRGLTIIELAQQSGIPARMICMFEQGMLPLDAANAEQLASALALPLTLLMRAADARSPGIAPGSQSRFPQILSRYLVAITLLFGALLLGTALAVVWPLFSSVRRVDASAAHSANAAAAVIIPTTIQYERTAVATALPIPTATQIPTPSATSAPTVAAGGSPRACPLLAEPQRVVITQGYGEATHAPTNTSGAIDLGIDSDGDGYAEPDATSGVVILATQNGIARVWLGSWPGGNVIRVVDEQNGWNTLYAHLDEVSVSDGQAVTVGMPLGTVGSTGMTSGPHLHYEIWHYGENLNPTDMAPCWQMPR
ncbi:MAG: peptidoglycan DD-metalloendopeptidase family protein [Roseiflexaceae bacterium]|nr:peptidoglycan DD-metalloendopeptidase family protein [Roseiflexaceae bacterium]